MSLLALMWRLSAFAGAKRQDVVYLCHLVGDYRAFHVLIDGKRDDPARRNERMMNRIKPSCGLSSSVGWSSVLVNLVTCGIV